MSDSLKLHELQHARPPSSSPTPGVHTNSRPSSQWCHLILCRHLLLLHPILPSIGVFSNESTLRMRWPKYWSTMNIYCSVAQSCPTLHSPMNCSTPGFPVVHYLPGACSNSCPLSWWCHPTILSSVFPFCPQPFPASGSFPMSQLFASGGQSVGASASVLSMNIQDWFPLGLTSWISLQSKGLSRVFCHTTVQKHQFFGT